MAKIERSNERGKFTREEIRGFIAETKRKQSTVEGRRELAEQEARSAAAAKRTKGFVKFPELAKRTGTKPVLSVNQHRARLLGKL